MKPWDKDPIFGGAAAVKPPAASSVSARRRPWDTDPVDEKSTDEYWKQRAAEVYKPMHPELNLPAEPPMPVRTSNSAPRSSLMQPGTLIPDARRAPAPVPYKRPDFSHLRSPNILQQYKTRNPEDFAKAKTLIDQADSLGDTLSEQDEAEALRTKAQQILDTIIPSGDIGLRYFGDNLVRLSPADEANVQAAEQQAGIKSQQKEAWTGGLAQGYQGLGNSLAQPLESAGLIEPGVTASGIRLNQAKEDIALEETDNSTMRKYLRGALRSATQAIPTAVVPNVGLPLMIGSFTSGSYAEAKTEALDAGKSEAEAEQFARKMALIEGGVTTGFQMLGLGGAEKVLTGGLRRELAKTTIKAFAKQLSAEEVEELSIATMQNMLRNKDQINPQNYADVWKETFLQTAVTFGAFSTPGAARTAAKTLQSSREAKAKAAEATTSADSAKAWASQPGNAEAAKKIAAVVAKGEPVSRSTMEAAGLPKLDAARRAKFGDWVKKAVDSKPAEAAAEPVVGAERGVSSSPSPQATPGPGTDVTPDADTLAETAAYEPADATTGTAPPSTETWRGDVTKDPRWLAARKAGTLKPPPKRGLFRTAGPTDETMSPEELGPQPKRMLGPMTPRQEITQTQEMPPNVEAARDAAPVEAEVSEAVVEPVAQRRGEAIPPEPLAEVLPASSDSGISGIDDLREPIAAPQAAAQPAKKLSQPAKAKLTPQTARQRLARYVAAKRYSDPARRNLRDADLNYKKLKDAADQERRREIAEDAAATRIAKEHDREKAQAEIAAGTINRQNVKYASLRDVNPELRRRIQDEARRLLGEAKSQSTADALKKIARGDGSDTGAAVEQQKDRIIGILTGEIDQRGIVKKKSEAPRPADPVVTLLLQPVEQRRETIDEARRSIGSERPNELAEYARSEAARKLNADVGLDEPLQVPSEEQVGDALADIADMAGVGTDANSEGEFGFGANAPADIPHTTGTKNAKTDELRRNAELGDRPPVEPESREDWDSQAAQRMAADPNYAVKLAAELAAKPRALNPIEEMTLNRHIRDLENRRLGGEDVDSELRTAVEASERAGTVWGRAGVARQAERDADFTLAGIVRQHLRSTNESPTDEQLAKYAEMADKIKQLEGELSEKNQKLAQAEIDRQIAEAKAASNKPTPPSSPSAPKGTRRERLQRQATDAVAAFKDAWSEVSKSLASASSRPTSGGLDVKTVESLGKAAKAAAVVVKAYTELGVDSLLELLARIKKDIGDITAEQKKLLEDEWAKFSSNKKADRPQPENTDAAEIGELARKLTRFAVESGIEGRDNVIDAVHAELRRMGVDVTRSQTMEAMSGYGDFRELSKDEASIKIRGIKGEIQQLLKLEDIQSGKAPKKTGVERREPTDEERRLIKLVNEAKKRGGYEVTNPEKQLKSALDAAKTALRNRITDLEQEIASREKTVKEQTPLKADAELTELRAKRDALLEEHRKVFPPQKTALTDAQKLKLAEQALDRQIAVLESDLAAGKLMPKEKGTPHASPALEAKRSRLAALKKIRDEARSVNPEYQARQAAAMLDAAKAAARKRITELEQEIATRTKTTSERKSSPVDAELAVLREQREKLQEEHKKIFPAKKSMLSDAQRLKMAEKALERQIGQMQADLDAGRLSPKPKAAPLTSPDIEAKRKQLASLKEIREQARAASPEYQAQETAKQLATYRKSLERQMAFWTQRRDDARAGKLPTKRKLTEPDKDVLETKYQIELVRRQAQAEIEEAARASRGRVGKALGFGGDLLDLSRAIQTGYELSAVLRQGAYYTLGFPRQALPAIAKSMQAVFSRRADFAIHDNLMQRPNHVDYARGGLATTASDGPLSQREEMLRSRLLSWVASKDGAAWALPRWGAEGLLGGERAFRSFLNTMRADLFDYMKASVEASRPGTWSEDDAKIIGSASNVFSGRGTLRNAVGLSRVFFAPRWVWSRAQLLAGQPMWKGNAATRLAVGKVYVRAALGMAAFMALKNFTYALLADDDEHEPKYEFDPRSSDFGKMKLGETRLDSGTGFNQLVVLATRLLTGQTKRGSGEIVSLRGEDVPPGADDTRDIIHRFLDSKLAPLPGAVLDFVAGKNVVGGDSSASEILTSRVTPMTWRDIWEAEKELNVPQGTVAAIEAFFGTGISTYGPKSAYRNADEAGRKELVEKGLKGLARKPLSPEYLGMLSDEEKAKFKKGINKSLMNAANVLAESRPAKGSKHDDWKKEGDNAFKKLTENGVSFQHLRNEYEKYLYLEVDDEAARDARLERFRQRYLRIKNAQK